MAKTKVEKYSPNDVEQGYRILSATNPVYFARGLKIPSASGPTLFDECIEDFQRECFDLLAPSLIAVRDGAMPPIRRFWIERTKKAAKDADIAICLLWLMAFAKRPLLCQVSAANQKQAGIIKRRARDLLHYNPWLNDRVCIQLNRIIGVNGLAEVIIEATGSSGAKQGDTPDLLILNELVHVDRWGVNETHMANADGVPRGVVIVSTNAGIKGTRAWAWRQIAVNDPQRWKMHVWKGRAPWLSDQDMEEARSRDPVGAEFARLWKGEWISGTGGAVPESDLDRCFRLSAPLEAPESGWEYLAGLDLGISHDHAGVTMLGVNVAEQRIKVGRVRGFMPCIPNDKGIKEVDAAAVKAECLELHRRFRVTWFGYDPAAGGSFMAQELRRAGVPMHEMTFSSKANQNAMALAFVQTVKGGRLECYEDLEGRLRRDFGKFQIVPKTPSGYQLEAVSDEWGHADVGVALVLCLPEAIKRIGLSFNGLTSDDVLHDTLVDEEMGSEEMATMPADLREICELYEDGSNLPRRPRLSRYGG